MEKEPVRETGYVSEEGAQESSTQGTIETDRQTDGETGRKNKHQCSINLGTVDACNTSPGEAETGGLLGVEG